MERAPHPAIIGSILGLAGDLVTLENASGVAEVGLTADTLVRVFGHHGSLSDLRVGMHVEIRTGRMPSGGVEALVIRVEDDFALVDIEGIVDSIQPGRLDIVSFQLEAVALAITPRTFVMDHGALVPASRLRPGDHIDIKAIRDADERLVALRIHVAARASAERARGGVRPRQSGPSAEWALGSTRPRPGG